MIRLRLIADDCFQTGMLVLIGYLAVCVPLFVHAEEPSILQLFVIQTDGSGPKHL